MYTSVTSQAPSGAKDVEQNPVSEYSVVDLFSGAGGMSCGFHHHPRFRIAGAVDVEIGKPSTGEGALECNATYAANVGIAPLSLDLATTPPAELCQALPQATADVLIACPPCTGFSRTVSRNHVVDDPRNSLVTRVAEYAARLEPKIIVMENARELINGNFNHHYRALLERLYALGYEVHGKVYRFDRFGLPQVRERAVIVGVRQDLRLRTLDDLWSGRRVRSDATHVRRAIECLPPVEAGRPDPSDQFHVSTGFKDDISLRRLQAIPPDGGSWVSLIGNPATEQYLTPQMRRSIDRHRLNSYCDAYGRLWWDRPAATIKRECCHIGNGRYAHPEQHRLCTVREMSLLQGFPRNYRFVSSSRKNMYRHIGDAVPPLVAHQLAWVCDWVLTSRRPPVEQVLLPGCHLTAADLEWFEGEQLHIDGTR
jgi:DNA (cytosine-5)-methyltransferase 1